MTSVVWAWALAVAGAVAIERCGRPAARLAAPRAAAVLFRLAVFTFVFGFFLIAAWRPWFAAAATLVFTAVFSAISAGKLRYTYEPLVFSDLAFVADIFRHATLFHTTFLGPLFVLAAVASLAGFIAVWCGYEGALETGGPWRIAALVAWGAAAAAPFMPGVRRSFERAALGLGTAPEVFHDVAAHGLLATLVIDWLAWRGDDRTARMASWAPAAPAHLGRSERPADVIVAVQCEAFMDLRRLSAAAPDLPHLDAARRRALSWGRLGSAFAGGYTMRTEFSFLTGRPHRDFAFDRYYPYLGAAAYAPVAMPRALTNQGYACTFIHPFHGDFFQRHRALPALGFARMITLDAFEGAERAGDYVSDKAVGERIIREAQAAKGRAFLFAATMENHEPWGAGRFPGCEDPVAVYGRHLVNGDALLGQLIAAFETWPGRMVLAFYGDHVPLLKEFADPFPETDTDYVLLDLGRDARADAPRGGEQRLEVHELTWNLFAAAGAGPGSPRT